MLCGVCPAERRSRHADPTASSMPSLTTPASTTPAATTPTPSKTHPATHAGLNTHGLPPAVARALQKHSVVVVALTTPRGQDDLAIKTGNGGLMDAEFIAQASCIENGWQEANTLRALECARDAGALNKADAEKLIENYRQLRRVEGILRRWSFEG